MKSEAAPLGVEIDREAELHALLAMAAHDLKNPLTSVTAHVEMMRADYVDVLGAEFARDLAAVERGLRRMARLTEGLLDYARAGHTLSLDAVGLHEMVADVIEDYAAGGDPPEVTVTGTLPDVVADAGLLRHVLDNLIGNAIKYSWPGVTPEVRVGARVRADGVVRVEVADRGIGIAAADRPRVFDAFRRGANSGGYSGTGLGLAICRRIVECHGGRVGVEANPGGGSRFWFTVPAAVRVPVSPAARPTG